MPKRRLYIDGGAENEASSSSVSERGRGPQQATTGQSRRSAAQRRSSDVLLRLSDACNKHATYHKGRKNTGQSEDDEDNLPERCRSDLQILRNLLPKVEKSFQPPAPGKKGPEAEDIAHLCDFYNSVLRGAYCPHAPHLFQRGQSAKDVLARVHNLFQHLTSRTVVASAKMAPAAESNETSARPVVQAVCSTIAHLLSFLADPLIYSCIVSDLVNLLEDCAVVLEGKMLPVKLVVLDRTSEHCSFEHECTLEMQQMDEIWTLQAATLLVLQTFLADLKSKRIKSQPETLPGSSTPSLSTLRSGSVDLVYTPDLIDNESLTSLISGLRQVLLSTQPPKSSFQLWTQRKLAAIKVLTQLIRDWHQYTSIMPTTLAEVAVLIARATQTALNSRSKESSDYMTALAILLRLAILEPPKTQGASGQEAIMWTVRAPSLSTLLDCVKSISKRPIDRRNVLDAMVLRLVHVMLHTTYDSQKLERIAVTYCISHGVFPDLMSLIHDPKLSNHTVGILGRLVSLVSSLDDMSEICSFALDSHSEMDERNDAEIDKTDSIGTEKQRNDEGLPLIVGSKRKRGSVSPTRAALRPLEFSPSKPNKKGEACAAALQNISLPRPALWIEALRSLFCDSLDAAQRLAGSFFPDAAQNVTTDSTTSPKIAGQLVLGDDAALVMGALRFVLHMVHLSWLLDQNDTVGISGYVGIAKILAESLQACCAAFAHCDVNAFSQSDTNVAQIVISCGLYAHFTVGPLILQLESPEATALRSALDAFACICSRVCAPKTVANACSIHAYEQGGKSLCSNISGCLKSLADFNSSTQGNVVSGLPFALCPCSCLKDSWLMGLGTLRLVFAMDTIDSLPFGTRSSLLASLHPLPEAVDPMPPVAKTGPTEIRALNCLLESAQNDMSSPSAVSDISSLSVSALSFVPLLLSSHARVGAQEAKLASASPGDGNIPNTQGTDRFSSLMVSFLRQFLLLITESFDARDTDLCYTVLLTVHRVHNLVSKPHFYDASQLRYDASQILKYIFGKESLTEDAPAAPPQLELDIILREVTCAVAEKIQQDHENPMVRRLRWRCIANSVLGFSSLELRQQIVQGGESIEEAPAGDSARSTEDSRPQSWFFWLLVAGFSDNDQMVREYISRRLHKVILSENYSFLLSHFSSNETFQAFSIYSRSSQRQKTSSQHAYELEQASEIVASGFFREVDRLLHDSGGFSESQLTFTMAKPGSGETSRKDQKVQGDRVSLERSAVRILVSFCRFSDLETPLGKCLFEKAFLRLVRLWAATTVDKSIDAPFPDLHTTSSSKALSFGEFARLSAFRPMGPLLLHQLSATFTGAIFCDILVLSADRSRAMQFLLLEAFIQSFLSDFNEVLARQQTTKGALSFVEDKLPSIVAQFVVEKDIELLRLTAAFRGFLGERCRDEKKARYGDARVVGASNAPSRRKYVSITASSQDLDKKTRNLCLEPKLIERILPLIFINSDRSGLVFFKKEVLKSMTLHEIMKHRDQHILKGLAWELGRDPDRVGPAMRAIKTAAIARLQEGPGSLQENEANRLASPEAQALGKKWVTSHFMYLLVNVIQYRWKTRTVRERLRALRCLHVLLEFLLPAESAQYFPQIMATVNAAIANVDICNGGREQDSSDVACLRLYAVKSLSRLIMDYQIETIALNLTTIVVSLIPVLEDEGTQERSLGFSATSESRDAAVSLLEYLTSGVTGRNLAHYFTEIPFLPSSPALENVHRSLRSNGVDFDNLLVLSSGTQHGGTLNRESLTNDGSGTVGSKTSLSSKNAERIVALQRRLGMICGLLDNESTLVRKVALQHLIDLLRSNRDLFHALIESEGSGSNKHYLTVQFREANSSATSSGSGRWLPRGAVTEMMEKLLARCVHEADSYIRILLATCLGEVGAIGEHRLGELKIGSSMGEESLDSPNSSYRWRLDQPPWQSQAAKYELQLITRHLVAALKAAPSSTDQHKVAFAIQQLLHLLDKSGCQNEEPIATGADEDTSRRPEMSKWLRDKLYESGVYEIIEPYFLSEFSEKSEGYVAKKPPFFKTSVSYYMWISNFCRWMIHDSKCSDLSRWKDFFFACRSAVRTQAGLSIAEFILPLLILDRICFGTSQDEVLIREELLEVLSFDLSSCMGQEDHQKAADAVFIVIDTLRNWAERATEERSKGRTSGSSVNKGRRQVSSRSNEDSTPITSWPAEETIERIIDVLKTIPLVVQADAAAKIGMHARALLLLEMASRKQHVVHVFEKSIDEQRKDATAPREESGFQSLGTPSSDHIDLDLMKTVLSRLDDCETMAAVGKDHVLVDPLLQVRDSIRQREASGDFESALQDYERALQVQGAENRDPNLESGALQCLLELGRFESVINQVAGLKQRGVTAVDEDLSGTTSFAVEAAWRLGRWQTLSDLIESEDGKPRPTLSSNHTYHICSGKAMLGLQRKEVLTVATAIQNAREVLMQSLSSVARESYARSYSEIVRLQCLRELENAHDFLCQENYEYSGQLTLDEIAHSTSTEGWSWDGRLSLVASYCASSVISTRVALARLSGDPVLEGSLFLNSGKRARKNGLQTVAENFFSQAQAAFASMPQNEFARNSKLGNLVDATREQLAKMKHQSGESAVALKILGQESVQRVIDQMLHDMETPEFLRKLAVKYERQRIGKLSGLAASVHDDDKALTDRFASRLLRLTQWMAEGGLKGGSEIMGRFRIIHKLAPNWEKGHFHFGKYVDSVMRSRLTAMASRYLEKETLYGLDEDEVRNNVIFRDKTCQNYTLLAMDHYATALALDTKHVYQALPRLLSLWFDFVSVRHDKINFDGVHTPSKSDFLDMLSRNQNEANACMAKNLKSIPSAAFYTAMPQLISRVVHANNETSLVVQGILLRVLTKFPQQAMWPLAWLKGSRNPERSKIGEEIFKNAQRNLTKTSKAMHKLLAAAHTLFQFLQDLAVYTGKDPHASTLQIKPWKGAVELSEFIPPVQAALSISLLSTTENGAKDYFPRTIPRMRAFSSRIGVMASKAKPKKLKAYAVPGTYKHASRSTAETAKGTSSSKPHSDDIGEIHFLVKQEAKGDLRKDARVQDLNNVINRLMASSSDTGGANRRRRRLHLRTFAVTCLSEDIGILEWVPATESLRNLVSKSHNPQTSAGCNRRRGNRLANFGDPTLRSHFEMCQNKYFKEGNLSKAAAMFEDKCLRPYPPLLYWWFVQKFHDPHAWYEARNRFTLSAAAWSAVGHVIGLGDRHSENILVDTSSGECVHVDFDCIFDKGLNLPRPEVVPFRLTANMQDAFGPTGADGLYSSGLQTAMRTLRDNRDTLLSVLEPFLKDPVIDWKRHRSQQKNGAGVNTTQDRQTKEAKRSIRVIDERLQGIYNLRNPNSKKYRRTDRISMDQDDELIHLLPLSVEGQVNKMIAEATSHENLVQLYVGWMPWV